MDEQDVPAFNPAIVAPTYNNSATLRGVIERAARHGVRVFVVNDGSHDDDQTADILSELNRTQRIRVIKHQRNLGKAAALYSGFAAAAAAGHSHALTIDTDGQLDPDEIPRLLEAARQHPRAMILGTRDASAADYPARSRTGRRISNFFIRLESGLRVSDSQCGFRVYPLQLVWMIPCRAGRYGLETEFLTRAAWAGCEVVTVPVSCRYFASAQQVSHFQPWRDTFRAVAMHARLVARALIPFPHHRWSLPPLQRHPGAMRLLDWINPLRAWRELREERLAPQELSTGVAVGVFIGNLPLFGVHTLLSLYTARRLHLHPLAVVVGSHVSTPPVGPALIIASIGLGHWLLHGQWMPLLPTWHATLREWTRLLGSYALDWTIGSALIGLALAVLAFFFSSILFRQVAAAAATTAAVRD